MSTDHRTTALERLRELRTRLDEDAGPDREAVLSECDLLIQAVEAFHMEAIRFRTYGLRRRLTSDPETFPADVAAILEAARTALGEAGFKL